MCFVIYCADNIDAESRLRGRNCRISVFFFFLLIFVFFFFFFSISLSNYFFFFFQAEDGIRDRTVTEFRRVLFRSFVSSCLCGLTWRSPRSYWIRWHDRRSHSWHTLVTLEGDSMTEARKHGLPRWR